MIIKIAAIIYCILATKIAFRAQEISVDESCGRIEIDNTDKHCKQMGAAFWFIVVDISGDSLQSYDFYEEKVLARDMIGQLLLTKKRYPEMAYKFPFGVVLAATSMLALRSLNSDTNDQPDFPKMLKTSEHSMMDEVLEFVGKEADSHAPNSSTQRIILYIANRKPEAETIKVLHRWDEDYKLGIRSTQVYFFVLARAGEDKFNFDTDASIDESRGLVFITAKSGDFPKLGGHAVQCACYLSDDCSLKNGTVQKPCHFSMVNKKEMCTSVVKEVVDYRPDNARYLDVVLASCAVKRPLTTFNCDRKQCMEDCDKKGWSEWSACDKYGNKNRLRLNGSDSHSQFTESCYKSQSEPCKPTTMTTSTSTAKTTEAPPTGLTSTWVLIFAVLFLSASILIAAIIIIFVRRRRRRLRSQITRLVVDRKGRVKRVVEPDSTVSTATSMMSMGGGASSTWGPGSTSTWGPGSVSFVDVRKKPPKNRHEPLRSSKERHRKPTSSKVKKDDRRTSKSPVDGKQIGSVSKAKSKSAKVSSIGLKQPLGKDSKSSKVTSSSSQVTKQSARI